MGLILNLQGLDKVLCLVWNETSSEHNIMTENLGSSSFCNFLISTIIFLLVSANTVYLLLLQYLVIIPSFCKVVLKRPNRSYKLFHKHFIKTSRLKYRALHFLLPFSLQLHRHNWRWLLSASGHSETVYIYAEPYK